MTLDPAADDPAALGEPDLDSPLPDGTARSSISKTDGMRPHTAAGRTSALGVRIAFPRLAATEPQP
jgi:hypothetical protein